MDAGWEERRELAANRGEPWRNRKWTELHLHRLSLARLATAPHRMFCTLLRSGRMGMDRGPQGGDSTYRALLALGPRTSHSPVVDPGSIKSRGGGGGARICNAMRAERYYWFFIIQNDDFGRNQLENAGKEGPRACL